MSGEVLTYPTDTAVSADDFVPTEKVSGGRVFRQKTKPQDLKVTPTGGSADTLANLTAIGAGATAGTVAASKAIVVDSNKDARGARIFGVTRVIESRGAHSTVNTAGAGTYTAAHLLTGKIVRDPTGGDRTDTLDSAANLVAAIASATVGDEIRCLIINNADNAETITLAVPASGSFAATNNAHTIAQNAQKEIIVRLTNVTATSEAYVVYG